MKFSILIFFMLLTLINLATPAESQSLKERLKTQRQNEKTRSVRPNIKNENSNSTEKEVPEIKNGKFITYHANGQPEKIANYKNNLLDGETTLYDTKGELLATFSLKQDLIVDMFDKPVSGTQITKYPNGETFISMELKNGLRNGLLIVYDINGSMVKHQRYKQGKLVEDLNPQ